MTIAPPATDRVLFETSRVQVLHEKDTGYDLVTFPDPRGAVVVARRTSRGVVHFAFVSQFRHTTGAASLEFPRGGAHPGESHTQTAVRELREETGHQVSADRATDLGAIWPDTGILRSDTRAVLFTITNEPGQASKDKSELDADLRVQWLNVGDVLGAIAHNKIECGYTLAAWAKVTARNLHYMP